MFVKPMKFNELDMKYPNVIYFNVLLLNIFTTNSVHLIFFFFVYTSQTQYYFILLSFIPMVFNVLKNCLLKLYHLYIFM